MATTLPSPRRFLFFDNAGVDYRCIWRVDTQTQEVVKIVPEHEAIHPFVFAHDGNAFVAYVEGPRIERVWQ